MLADCHSRPTYRPTHRRLHAHHNYYPLNTYIIYATGKYKIGLLYYKGRLRMLYRLNKSSKN